MAPAASKCNSCYNSCQTKAEVTAHQATGSSAGAFLRQLLHEGQECFPSPVPLPVRKYFPSPSRMKSAAQLWMSSWNSSFQHGVLGPVPLHIQATLRHLEAWGQRQLQMKPTRAFPVTYPGAGSDHKWPQTLSWEAGGVGGHLRVSHDHPGPSTNSIYADSLLYACKMCFGYLDNCSSVSVTDNKASKCNIAY